MTAYACVTWQAMRVFLSAAWRAAGNSAVWPALRAHFTLAFDAAGYDVILIETVGAGQAEVDVASRAHTTIVIDAPGLGDDVQANKAGILEIADILVVNKSDLPGAERTLRTLELAMHLAQPASGSNEGWHTPVLATSATTGIGIEALAEAVASHRQFLRASGGWDERERLRTRTQLEQDLAASLMDQFLDPDTAARFDALVHSVVERKLTPRAALDTLLGEELPVTKLIHVLRCDRGSV